MMEQEVAVRQPGLQQSHALRQHSLRQQHNVSRGWRFVEDVEVGRLGHLDHGTDRARFRCW